MKATDEILAIKILKKDFKQSQVAHTRTERSVLERVKHPFIVKLRYAFQTSQKLYFVLECPGEELFHLIMALRRGVACFYSACVVLALEQLHKLNIVYRE
jgi:protein-serine/threonine kinase